jgi:hypothetical protein
MNSDGGDHDDDAEDHRKAYEDLRQKFTHTAGDELKSGDWFLRFRWIFEAHAKRVDAEYLRKKYPGAGPANHAKKAIGLASRYAAFVGGTSAAGVTALELSVPLTGGLDVALAVPAIGAVFWAISGSRRACSFGRPTTSRPSTGRRCPLTTSRISTSCSPPRWASS